MSRNGKRAGKAGKTPLLRQFLRLSTTKRMGGNIIYIKSMEEWNAVLAESGETLVCVDFTATWCGPCRMIGPTFDEYSGEFTQAKFLKVDVDELNDVAAQCGISAMPTFQFYKGGKKIKEFMGANKAKLRQVIVELLG